MCRNIISTFTDDHKPLQAHNCNYVSPKGYESVLHVVKAVHYYNIFMKSSKNIFYFVLDHVNKLLLQFGWFVAVEREAAVLEIRCISTHPLGLSVFIHVFRSVLGSLSSIGKSLHEQTHRNADLGS